MNPTITILDIEAIGRPEAEIRALIPPFCAEKVALGNLKDPDKIAAKIADARATHGDDEVAKAALYAEYGQTAIVGLLARGEVKQHSLIDSDEPALLRNSWEYLMYVLSSGGLIVGFNIKSYDLPFMVKRSWFTGVRVPDRIFNPRKPKYPWSDSVIDLAEVWGTGNYGAKFTSLDSVLRLLGLPPKTGTGAEFAALWAKDRAAALQYNADDLEREAAVADRLIP